MTRRRLVQLAVLGIVGAVVPRARAARKALVSDLHVLADAADEAGLPIVSPVAGRRSAKLAFKLAKPALVRLDVLTTAQGAASEQPLPTRSAAARAATSAQLDAGARTLTWRPSSTLRARTYILRVTAEPADGAPARAAQTVVRVLGVDAAFAARSAAPGDRVDLLVQCDAKALAVQLLHCGSETEPTYGNEELKGTDVGDEVALAWGRTGTAPAPIHVGIGQWPSGLYAARVTADDGRVGYAPLVVRPAQPAQRVAVVLPTTTWAAYNFYDRDGDGWGDTWYARWATDSVDLTRPHAERGVPYRFRSYDLAFLHWLDQTGRRVDFYADEDLARFDAPSLRAAYDLVAFPGHTEYVGEPVLDVVQGYRDAGGNLLFLSANNLFRRVDSAGDAVQLVDEWRDLGRPEAAICGVQYIAGDRGQRQQPYVVVGADAAPWAFDGTGLGNGSAFGRYGIEIDARTDATPPGAIVLARIDDLLGPGRSAEMTYYEHPSGARVFSAGAMNFGGQVLLWPETTRLLENVWQRLTEPKS